MIIISFVNISIHGWQKYSKVHHGQSKSNELLSNNIFSEMD